LRPLRLLLVLMRRERFVCRTIILPKPTEHHLDRMAEASKKASCARGQITVQFDSKFHAVIDPAVSSITSQCAELSAHPSLHGAHLKKMQLGLEVGYELASACKLLLQCCILIPGSPSEFRCVPSPRRATATCALEHS
jgi:hypothetical protein